MFYFEGERFFEGTRSLFTAQGVEKPVLNAYRMLARMGDVRLAADSNHAWPLGRLDDGEASMPEEIDALATFNGRDCVTVLMRRHADDQYLADTRETAVTLRIEHLPVASSRVRLRHWRIDVRHSNSHTAWMTQGGPQGSVRRPAPRHQGPPGPRAAGTRARGGDPGRLSRLEDSVSPAERVAERDQATLMTWQ